MFDSAIRVRNRFRAFWGRPWGEACFPGGGKKGDGGLFGEKLKSRSDPTTAVMTPVPFASASPLLHLEIQSASESGFERRIAKFNGGLSWTFDQRVVSVVVLADLDANWRPREDVFQVGDFETRLKFPVCKLVDKLESEWKDDVSLPVQMARAQIESLRTAGDPEGRFRAKWQLVRSLYRAGYNADDVRELFRLIDWMMHLREDLEQRFRVELTEFEEQMKMPYVTSVERLAKAEGRTERREGPKGAPASSCDN